MEPAQSLTEGRKDKSLLDTSALIITIALCLHCIADITGDIAQLVERLVRNEKVRGSNPLISTTG